MNVRTGATRIILPLVALGLIAWRWSVDTIAPQGLQYEVPSLARVNWLESPWTYLYLNAFTFFSVLLLSFDRKVAYWKKWKYVAPAILLVGFPFIVWDVFFTVKGVWGFNPSYLSGAELLHLPLEEWLFFMTVPFACTFIYECLLCYLSVDPLAGVEKAITLILLGLFGLLALFHVGELYSWTTFVAATALLAWHYLFLEPGQRSRFYLAFAVSLLPFLVVNGTLTGAFTRQPVVLYNPGEYLGPRLLSIPADDMGYAFVLLLGNVAIFEFFRKNRLLSN